MAQLMIAAKDHGVDPDQKTFKGDYMDVREDGAIRCQKEGLPNAVWVVISDATRSEVLQYANRWHRIVDWTVVNSIPANDQWRMRVFAINNGAISGKGDLTRSQVEDWLAQFNITVFSATQNEIVVDIDIYQTAITPKFWECNDFSDVSFGSVSYNESTGIHRIEADYTLTTYNVEKIESLISKRATIISHIGKVVTFDLDSVEVRADLKRRVKEKTWDCIGRYQFHTSGANVDAIIGAGGEVTRTLAQVLAETLNKAEE